MHSKKAQKAQAALEYLITYGWALIVIATVIGVLVFVTTDSVNTSICTTFLSFVCKGIGIDGDTSVIVLQNATGQTISITPFSDICFDGKCGYATIKYGDTTYRFDTVEIPAGLEFTIKIQGIILADEISITYNENQTGLEKTETSSMSTGEEAELQPIYDCQSITEPGIYTLENDISLVIGSNCITIENDNITLDCQNHTITGPGGRGAYAMNKKNIAIVNCNFKELNTGIEFISVEDSLIGNNTVNSSEFGFFMSLVENSRIINNTINGNAIGIHISYSNNNTFNNNTVIDNYKSGIDVVRSNGNTFNNNTVCGRIPNIDCIDSIASGSGNIAGNVFECGPNLLYELCPLT